MPDLIDFKDLAAWLDADDPCWQSAVVDVQGDVFVLADPDIEGPMFDDFCYSPAIRVRLSTIPTDPRARRIYPARIRAAEALAEAAVSYVVHKGHYEEYPSPQREGPHINAEQVFMDALKTYREAK